VAESLPRRFPFLEAGGSFENRVAFVARGDVAAAAAGLKAKHYRRAEWAGLILND